MRTHLLALAVIIQSAAAEPVSLSGIYPHLTMFNGNGECGIGAVVPWQGKLWIITNAPHMPKGDEANKESPRKSGLPGYHGKGFYSGQGVYVDPLQSLRRLYRHLSAPSISAEDLE